MSVSPVCNVNKNGLLSPVADDFKIKPSSGSWVIVTSWSSPNFIMPPSAKNKSAKPKLAVPNVAPSFALGTTEVSAVKVFVLIPDVPLSIAPNPLVIEPLSNAPVVTMLELPAIAL